MQKRRKQYKVEKKMVNSFIKWPGGKRWLIPTLLSICPNKFNTYYEPFLGGGAVYFALEPEQAVISDINAELINLYHIMRDEPKQLAELLLRHQESHNSEYYYNIRMQVPEDRISQAARTLYLNRTCFNGMYRVNKAGLFNVPIGSKKNFISDIENFEEISRKLQSAKICNCDFSYNISRAGDKDLIFADPPYSIPRNPDTFVKYNQKLFNWNDQERLFTELNKARDRGSYIISTNIKNKNVEDMYIEAGYYVKTLERTSSIAGNVAKRGKVQELLITSFKWRDTSDKNWFN